MKSSMRAVAVAVLGLFAAIAAGAITPYNPYSGGAVTDDDGGYFSYNSARASTPPVPPSLHGSFRACRQGIARSYAYNSNVSGCALFICGLTWLSWGEQACNPMFDNNEPSYLVSACCASNNDQFDECIATQAHGSCIGRS